MLVQADPGDNPRFCKEKIRNEVPDTLDKQILLDTLPTIKSGQKVEMSYTIKNTDRTVGARLSSYIVTDFKDNNFPEHHIKIKLRGSAGQSLGAFGAKGIKFEVVGDCNDYVGKGLSGATISVRPPKVSELETNKNTIIGNTVLYGATSGNLFAAGQAGERFSVRNSGATAVVEGAGTNACEYMTGGCAVILGEVGDNFAAGMTGGMAFIYNPDNNLSDVINSGSVVWQRVETEYWSEFLHSLIQKHVEETSSNYAKKILDDWALSKESFYQICPKEMLDKLDNPISSKEPEKKAV